MNFGIAHRLFKPTGQVAKRAQAALHRYCKAAADALFRHHDIDILGLEPAAYRRVGIVGHRFVMENSERQAPRDASGSSGLRCWGDATSAPCGADVQSISDPRREVLDARIAQRRRIPGPEHARRHAAAIWRALSALEQRDETSLLEMMVGTEGVSQTAFRHYNERSAVRHAPILVRMRQEQRQRPFIQRGIERQHLKRGVMLGSLENGLRQLTQRSAGECRPHFRQHRVRGNELVFVLLAALGPFARGGIPFVTRQCQRQKIAGVHENPRTCLDRVSHGKPCCG